MANRNLEDSTSLAAILAGYQPIDSDLTAIAALSTTSFGRALLTLADAAALRTAAALGTAAVAAISDFVSATTAQNANRILAGPASGSAAAPTFRALTWPDIPAMTPSSTVFFFDDFLWGMTASARVQGASSAVTLNSSVNTDLGGHPGQVELNTGTATNGNAALGIPGVAGLAMLLLGNGVVTFETDVYVLDAVSDGTDTYTFGAGFSDNVVTGTDAVIFRYTHSVNSGKFECVTRSNGVETASDSGITVTQSNWYRLGITINAAASSVDFAINGTVVKTQTTNIPSGANRQTTPMIGMLKSAGTNARRWLVDYVYCRIDLTTPR